MKGENLIELIGLNKSFRVKSILLTFKTKWKNVLQQNSCPIFNLSKLILKYLAVHWGEKRKTPPKHWTGFLITINCKIVAQSSQLPFLNCWNLLFSGLILNSLTLLTLGDFNLSSLKAAQEFKAVMITIGLSQVISGLTPVANEVDLVDFVLVDKSLFQNQGVD